MCTAALYWYGHPGDKYTLISLLPAISVLWCPILEGEYCHKFQSHPLFLGSQTRPFTAFVFFFPREVHCIYKCGLITRILVDSVAPLLFVPKATSSVYV